VAYSSFNHSPHHGHHPSISEMDAEEFKNANPPLEEGDEDTQEISHRRSYQPDVSYNAQGSSQRHHAHSSMPNAPQQLEAGMSFQRSSAAAVRRSAVSEEGSQYPPPATHEDLPPGWVLRCDEGGNLYYFNQNTQQSQWEAPSFDAEH